MLDHPLARVARTAVEKYGRDDVAGQAAALAYFAIFSIFPLLLVTISLVGFFIDPERFDVQQRLLALVGSPEVRDLITQTLEHFQENRVGAGLIGIGTLLFAATGIFAALNRAFTVIWETRGNGEGRDLRATVTSVVLDRLVAFGLLLGGAALILAAVLGNLTLDLLGEFTTWLPQSGLLMGWARRLLTVALLAVALAVIYKVLPRPHPAWGDVWAAALVAAVLLAALQALAGLIFSRINFSSYGAVGGVMTLLMWIFICAQIILVGGELSYAWAHVFGSRRGKREAASPEDQEAESPADPKMAPPLG
ncbi:MAG TPA: YihY/virulence factor BrkB family protein [Chloroflexaceae bacterium]|mgnify:CR=1 FL=1|nr:YihY/virulence factor BrkB family protein [Chloroflexaceae bacterium]